MQQNQLVSCPFNSSHRMHPNRLIFHISRECKERKMNKHQYRHCPYNFLHIFRGEDIEQHIMNCPDKTPTEEYVFTEEPQIQAEIPEGDPNWGLNQQQSMPIEEINTKNDNELIDQFNNLKLQRKDDIWDQLWKQQEQNNDDDDFDMM